MVVSSQLGGCSENGKLGVHSRLPKTHVVLRVGVGGVGVMLACCVDIGVCACRRAW